MHKTAVDTFSRRVVNGARHFCTNLHVLDFTRHTVNTMCKTVCTEHTQQHYDKRQELC